VGYYFAQGNVSVGCAPDLGSLRARPLRLHGGRRGPRRCSTTGGPRGCTGARSRSPKWPGRRPRGSLAEEEESVSRHQAVRPPLGWVGLDGGHGI